MRIGFLLTCGPDKEETFTVLKLSSEFLERGDEVDIFFMDEGIYNLVPDNFNKTSEQFSKLINKGCRLSICSQSARERGITADILINGVNPSSLYQLSRITGASDRFLSFTL